MRVNEFKRKADSLEKGEGGGQEIRAARGASDWLGIAPLHRACMFTSLSRVAACIAGSRG